MESVYLDVNADICDSLHMLFLASGSAKGKKDREHLFWAVTVPSSYNKFVINYRIVFL